MLEQETTEIHSKDSCSMFHPCSRHHKTCEQEKLPNTGLGQMAGQHKPVNTHGQHTYKAGGRETSEHENPITPTAHLTTCHLVLGLPYHFMPQLHCGSAGMRFGNIFCEIKKNKMRK
jgi:hypothetical protein